MEDMDEQHFEMGPFFRLTELLQHLVFHSRFQHLLFISSQCYYSVPGGKRLPGEQKKRGKTIQDGVGA